MTSPLSNLLNQPSSIEPHLPPSPSLVSVLVKRALPVDAQECRHIKKRQVTDQTLASKKLVDSVREFFWYSMTDNLFACKCLKVAKESESVNVAIDMALKGLRVPQVENRIRAELHYECALRLYERNQPNDIDIAVGFISLAARLFDDDRLMKAESLRVLTCLLTQRNRVDDLDHAIKAANTGFKLTDHPLVKAGLLNELSYAYLLRNLPKLTNKTPLSDLDWAISTAQSGLELSFDFPETKARLLNALAVACFCRNLPSSPDRSLSDRELAINKLTEAVNLPLSDLSLKSKILDNLIFAKQEMLSQEEALSSSLVSPLFSPL